MRNKLLVAVMVALGLASCNRDMVYHHYEHVPNNGWEKGDTIKFGISPVTAGGIYHEELELRIDDYFPFIGLTLKVEQTILPKQEKHFQTINLSLMEKNGTVKGSGISHYQYQFHLNDLTLEQGDSVSIHITHNMKREIIPGVTDVGISLRKNP